VLLLRERGPNVEILMLRRAESIAFGGVWAFPGGSVDAVDGDARCDLQATLRRAAVRETLEEAGGGVDAQGESVRMEQAMIAWSRWVTPVVLPRRFDTWFFATCAPDGFDAVVDGVEAVEGRWLAPAAALAARALGTMKMLPPTAITLLDLQASHAQHGGLAALLQGESRRQIVPIQPRVTGAAGQWVAIYPWDPQYASLAGEGFELHDGVPEYLARLPSRLPLASTGG
jgi:8-oxo-dGTP pyrophosphatase MutT (NUDIX family)